MFVTMPGMRFISLILCLSSISTCSQYLITLASSYLPSGYKYEDRLYVAISL